MKTEKPAPLVSALALCCVALLAYGLISACAPAVGESDSRDEGQPRNAVRFELRLASEEPVEGWESQIIPIDGRELYLSPQVQLSNADVAKAWFQPKGDQFAVGLYLTEEGAMKLAAVTGQNVGKILAILIDGRVVSAPRIMARISDRAEIHGNFTEQEARDLAAALDPGRGNE